MTDPQLRRRTFLGSAAGMAVAAAPQVLRGQEKTYRVGFIGLGRRGRANLHSAMKSPRVEIAAFSEIYKPNLEKALEIVPDRDKVKLYPDFRDLLADKSIDAVCIATPDHWHAYQTVEACKAGKDVYVEKPISVTVYEGQMMVKAARKYKRVVQVGTQQRSGEHFQEVVEMMHQGVLGDVSFVRTWNFGNLTPEGIGNPPDSAPPADLDWDMWLGPAPKVPFNKNRFGVEPDRYSDFRWFWDYAGGMMTDWGIHLLDIVLWAMKEPGPRSIVCIGGKYAIKDNRETPDTIIATFEFPGFAATYENRIANALPLDGKGYGIDFHGTNGTLFVDRQGWRITPETRDVATGKMERMGSAEGEVKNNTTDDHWVNFIKCMDTREKPIADILEGHRSTTTALLGNIALRSKQRVDWDPVAETTDNAEARSFLQRPYRAPWKLEL